MTHKEIQELIKLIDKSSLAEVKVKVGDFEFSARTQHYFDGKQKGATNIYPQVQQAQPSYQVPPAAPAAPAAPPSQEATPDIQQPAKVEAPASGLVEIKSPMVGTFYRSASPDKPSYVQIGDVIEAGTVVCIVEAMKLFNEIESEVRGKIVKVLIDDASPVEYDQPIFLVDPKG
jgi:acetyl-CoA carboxylase biotin carboxyl carrier protein